MHISTHTKSISFNLLHAGARRNNIDMSYLKVQQVSFSIRCWIPVHSLIFSSKVVLFGFGDHQAPPFELLVQFCKDAKTWLDKDTSNVVVIHCKAGKGRTGTMIAALLLYMGYATNADEAIQIYGTKRTTDGKVCGMDGLCQYLYLLNMQPLGHHYPKPDTICPLL